MDANNLTSLIARFDYGMLLARASELARSGRLLEAEALISGERGVRESWKGMDLLARIYVKQGNYAEALRLWQKLSQIDHSANTSEQCIHTLATFVEAELKRQRLVLIDLAAAWGVVFFTMLAFGIHHWVK